MTRTRILLAVLATAVAFVSASAQDAAAADNGATQSGSLRGRAASPTDNDAVTDEDKAFWGRLMQEVDGSMPPTTAAATNAPVPRPTMPAPTDRPTRSPTTMAPVTPPTKAPVNPPTEPPVAPPTTPPVNPPTTFAPVVEPTEPPLPAPITSAPVVEPTTDSPVSVPTNSAPIVGATTESPVSAPTISAPVADPATESPVSGPTGTELPVTQKPSSSGSAASSDTTGSPTIEATLSSTTLAPGVDPATESPVAPHTTTELPVTQAPSSPGSTAGSDTAEAPTTETTSTTLAPTYTPFITDPPRPGQCPARVFTRCNTVDGNIPCMRLEIPDDKESPDCVVRVLYTYNMTNFGEEERRVYSLSVLRNDVLTIVTNLAENVPIIKLEPGDSYLAVGTEMDMDICTEKGLDIFDAKVDITGGPLVTSEITITCVSDEGVICDDIVQDPTSDDCLVDVTYTYDITNMADIDFFIWKFERTRAGVTVDLVDLLGDETTVLIGGSTSLQEIEEINRCEALPMFETSTYIRKEPFFATLCKDTYYFPIGLEPNVY